MEYTQWECTTDIVRYQKQSLNPCCNGIYSMRVNNYDNIKRYRTVLILVVMEYTQWANSIINNNKLSCLNPCCNGIYSMSTSVHFSFTLSSSS